MAVLWDLDDTLLMTREFLLPAAARNAAAALLAAGFPAGLEDLMSLWGRHGFRGERRVLERLISDVALAEREQCIRVLEDNYRSFPTARNVVLVADAKRVLDDLRGTFEHHLITRGIHEMQSRKIELSGLRAYFETVTIVSGECGDTKRTAFGRILAAPGIRKRRSWCIGDNPHDEIEAAASLGLKSIRIRRGIHAALRCDAASYCAESLRDVLEILLRSGVGGRTGERPA